MASHLSRKRPADTFLDFLTNSSSIVIVFLGELSAALSASTSASDNSAEAVTHYLEANPDSSLASILDVDNQAKKLETVAEDILQNFLDPRAYTCEPVRLFLKEILAGVILEMTVTSCSKPEWLNGWIVYLLEEGEPELMNAIDAGMGGATGNQTSVNGHGGGNHIEGGPGKKGHERRVSKAESAMEEAMQEVQRLNQLIAEDDAKKSSRQSESVDGTSRASTSVRSIGGSESVDSEPGASQPFTSFDQIVPSAGPTALQAEPTQPRPALARSQTDTLTLHEAKVVIFDDAVPGDKGNIRSRPTIDYLLQIEPASSSHPGWMIARKYADFETLHEVLRRISKVAGVTGFSYKHEALPLWKGSTKAALREELERYLCDALSYRQLAESEGMKRFLEKDQEQTKSPSAGSKGMPGLGWPNPVAFETMGKGMLDVLASAPKGAAGGGKAILGGVSGALGGIGSISQKKSTTSSSIASVHTAAPRNSYSSPVSASGSDTTLDQGYTSSPLHHSRLSQEDFRSSASGRDESPHMSALADGRPSTLEEEPTDLSTSSPSLNRGSSSLELNRPVTLLDTLPPPPSDIPDDYGSSNPTPASSTILSNHTHMRSSTTSLNGSTAEPASATLSAKPVLPKKQSAPLSEAEARVAIELFFALITSLYTLSSAWNIRHTLLAAAKTYLLRPGNPNLESIRALLQESVIDANTSDVGMASHIHKVISNAFPTEEELKAWPAELTPVEQEELRQKARRLLVAKGMPQALRGVMGGAASADAMGKVFDALQKKEVLRGVIGGVLVQGVKAIVQ